jgi:hypothetical protein
MGLLMAAGGFCLLPTTTLLALEPGDMRAGPERSLDQLGPRADDMDSLRTGTRARHGADEQDRYSSDRYLVGNGLGDLTKGAVVCQRVSELSARADLAKQVRILVKEHMVDRIRERTGRETEQDIEVTREEIVQEYLQGVSIVDRRIDEATQTCSATAVMLKHQIPPHHSPGPMAPVPIPDR